MGETSTLLYEESFTDLLAMADGADNASWVPSNDTSELFESFLLWNSSLEATSTLGPLGTEIKEVRDLLEPGKLSGA